MEKTFKRDVCALDAVFEFVNSFLSAQKVGEKVTYSIMLAVEELFTNLIKHNVKQHAAREKDAEKQGEGQHDPGAGEGGKNDISISLERDAEHLIVRLTDFGVEPSSIPENEEIDIALPLQERKVGGLGIHLVRNLVDKLTYEYKDGNLSVTVIKSMENQDV